MLMSLFTYPFSLRGSSRDSIGNILTFILVSTINVFHCFLKIHSPSISWPFSILILLFSSLQHSFLVKWDCVPIPSMLLPSGFCTIYYHFPSLKYSLFPPYLIWVFIEYTLFAQSRVGVHNHGNTIRPWTPASLCSPRSHVSLSVAFT